MFLTLLLACDPTPRDATEPPGDPARMARFAVLADPHVTSDSERADRLRAAVDWLSEDPGLELVVILGDVAWGPGLEVAPAILGALTVPWVPVTGDNEIHAGDEARYHSTWGPQFTALEGQLDGWSRAMVPVHNPELDGQSWFDNHAFDLGGVHFTMVDWCNRTESGALGELGDLHDFEGGTLPWLEADLDARQATPWLLLAHIPTHLGMLDLAEMGTLEARLEPHVPDLVGIFAGHLHLDSEVPVDELDTTAYVVDAAWDDPLAIRLVEVWGDGHEVWLDQEHIEVPWPR